ncbi:MAG TPA: hypothetical protein VFJ06_07200 [Halococcus sp.]|nr:hypothetical protein [Halococcus sp.]
MATRTHELSDHLPRKNPVRDAILAVVWVFFFALGVHEVVGDSIRFSAFLLTLFAGILLGVGFTHWLRRTESGFRANDLYRNAQTGRKIVFAVVIIIPMVAVMYAATLLGISLNLVIVGFLGGLFGKRLVDFVLVYSLSE